MPKREDPDAPHRYVRARISSANLRGGDPTHYGWSNDLPCRICGASELSTAHVVYEPRRPSLAAAQAAIVAAGGSVA